MLHYVQKNSRCTNTGWGELMAHQNISFGMFDVETNFTEYHLFHRAFNTGTLERNIKSTWFGRPQFSPLEDTKFLSSNFTLRLRRQWCHYMKSCIYSLIFTTHSSLINAKKSSHSLLEGVPVCGWFSRMHKKYLTSKRTRSENWKFTFFYCTYVVHQAHGQTNIQAKI